MANKVFFNKDEQDVVKMSELLEQCNKFINGDISHDMLIEWSNNVKFYSFLPIREKIYNIIYILMNCVYSDDLTERFISLEMNKFWYLLIPYTNIELDDNLMNEDNYNLLYAICYEWISDRVKTDYNVCLSLFDTIMNYLKIDDLSMIFEDLSKTDFGKMMDSNNKLVANLIKEKDVIKDLANIMVYNNHEFSEINKSLSKTIVEEINSSNKDIKK